MWRTDSFDKILMLERLKAGEGDDRGWDGWMASLSRWTWIWVNSARWWWPGRSGRLQSIGSQRTRLNDWTKTETDSAFSCDFGVFTTVGELSLFYLLFFLSPFNLKHFYQNHRKINSILSYGLMVLIRDYFILYVLI